MGESTLPAFLTSVLDGDEWSASCPGRFHPRDKSLGTKWTRLSGDPTGELHVTAESKVAAPAGNRTTVFQSLANHYTKESMAAHI